MSEEALNLEAVERWEHLYNTDLPRFIDEMYAKDSEVCAMGVKTMKTPEQVHAEDFYALEAAILKTIPDRKTHVERTLAQGDTVVVEGVWSGTEEGSARMWNVPFCAILIFRDGKIVVDRTYMSETPLPALSSGE